VVPPPPEGGGLHHYKTIMINMEVSTTAFRVKVNRDGNLIDAPAISVFPFLRRELIEYDYDPRMKRHVQKYSFFFYDKENEILNVPVHLKEAFANYVQNNLGFVNMIHRQANLYDRINISNIGTMSDRDYQVDAINFLTSAEPMKALDSQTGCLEGNTLVTFNCGREDFDLTIADAYHCKSEILNNPLYITAYNGHKFQWHEVEDIVDSGFKTTYCITLADGNFIICTADHLIMTNGGWVVAIDTLNELIMIKGGRYHIDRSPNFIKVVSIKKYGVVNTYDIVCKTPFHNFLANNIVVHNSGKSYIAARTIMDLSLRTLIVLPASLVVQWTSVLESLTDAKLCILRGQKSIIEALNNPDRADIYLASVSTLQEYAEKNDNYEGMPSIQRFIEYLKFGIKIVDECHINFYANTLIDVQSDVRHNIYLSATHMRSSRGSDAIFKRIFPNTIKFSNGRYNKYVNITECHYATGAIFDKYVSTNRGYSQFKYEKYLLHHPTMLNKIFDNLNEVVNRHYISVKSTGQKLLILVGLVDFAELVENWFKTQYPTLNSNLYIHGTPDDILGTSEVIISTIGSCGTGKDIKDLRTLIMFISFASETLAYQTLGRLRKMDDTPEFVYMINIDLKHHIRHCFSKQKIYRNVAKQFSITEV